MGVIQGSINNLLNIATVAARISPLGEETISQKKGVAEAIAAKTKLEKEAELAALKAKQVIKGSEKYFTKVGEVDKRYNAENLEGLEGELDIAIGHLQKAEALSSNPERQQLLENAYASKAKLRQGAISKREQAEKKAQEELKEKQLEKQKSDWFRESFTIEGGGW